MRPVRVLTAILLPLALASTVAQAQDASAECSVNVYQPNQLAQAGLTIQRAGGAQTVEDAKKALRDAMKYLNDEKKVASNPSGAAFLRAQVNVLWLHQEGVTDVMTNESLGRSGLKTATVDLVAETDSLLKVVEAVGPGCKEATVQWRQAKPWTDRLNAAYTHLGANAVDSAEYYVKRASLLNMDSPFVHNALAQVANARGNKTEMLSHLKVAIEQAEGDTSMVETLRQMKFQYAAAAQQQAMTGGPNSGPAANKDVLLKEAVDIYMGILSTDPAAKEAAYAFSAASEIVALQGDTARGRAILAQLAADPAPYDDLTLLLAADMARLIQRNDDAMKMYAAALEKNPNVRDANYFLAFMYYEKKDAAKMLPLTKKVIELDPSNPDNYLLHSEALKLAATTEKDAAKKATLLKEAEAASSMEATMPHRVLVSQFERRAEGALIGGTIENRGKAAKSYDIVIELLDKDGSVVESMTANVPSVAPNGMGQFSVTPTKPGIVAYRYQAIK
jgi:tetratricopeptide (TPR) repeat protein